MSYVSLLRAELKTPVKYVHLIPIIFVYYSGRLPQRVAFYIFECVRTHSTRVQTTFKVV